MAIVREMNHEAWNGWVKTRPLVIQEICRKLPPDRLYQIKATGQRVTIFSYSEDGTVTVDIGGKYNSLIFERRVFGVSPAALQEVDLPDDDEQFLVMIEEPEQISDVVSSLKDRLNND